MNGDEKLVYEVVIPTLNKLDGKIDSNFRVLSDKLDKMVDQRDLEEVKKRIAANEVAIKDLQKSAISPAQVKELVGQTLNTAEARGWSQTEIRIAQIGSIVLASGLILQLYQVFFK